MSTTTHSSMICVSGSQAKTLNDYSPPVRFTSPRIDRSVSPHLISPHFASTDRTRFVSSPCASTQQPPSTHPSSRPSTSLFVTNQPPSDPTTPLVSVSLPVHIRLSAFLPVTPPTPPSPPTPPPRPARLQLRLLFSCLVSPISDLPARSPTSRPARTLRIIISALLRLLFSARLSTTP